ncbi:MAG TPA: HD domain-containing phosphohydrolase [Gammaproteobacteria bacterium]|nr:HD domain-containing phosphohydrolase [Gammaproteobacteria bacterium]
MEPEGAALSASKDTPQLGHYLGHLTAVNQQRNVIATEDIVNQSGALVARQGARIDVATARRIALHKLAKPLEVQVQIEGTLDKKDIINTLGTLVTEFDDLKTIEDKLRFQRDFPGMLQQNINLVLRQKLTVMAVLHPQLLKQTLLGAWLATLVARELGLEDTIIHRASMAALARDLGLLHIAPELLNKKGSFTPPEWRAMQSHVVIGQLILKDVAGMHPDIATAVLEHHERLDGTGYPTGKENEHLGLLGQILSMADALCSIRFKRFGTTGNHLGDVQPFLLMNSSCYQRSVYDAVCSVLRKAGLQRTSINPYGDQQTLLRQLVQRAKDIQHIVPGLNRLVTLLQSLKLGTHTKELTRLVSQTHNIIHSSGIINEEIISWLEGITHEPQPAEIPFLCEMDLLQSELLWHLNRVRHALAIFLYENNDLAPLITQELTKLINSLSDLQTAACSLAKNSSGVN